MTTVIAVAVAAIVVVAALFAVAVAAVDAVTANSFVQFFYRIYCSTACDRGQIKAIRHLFDLNSN